MHELWQYVNPSTGIDWTNSSKTYTELLCFTYVCTWSTVGPSDSWISHKWRYFQDLLIETYINQVRQDRQNNTGCEMIELQQALSRKKYGNPWLQWTELNSIGFAKQKNDHFFLQPYATNHTILKRIMTYEQEQKHRKAADFQESTPGEIEGTRKLVTPPNWKSRQTHKMQGGKKPPITKKEVEKR